MLVRFEKKKYLLNSNGGIYVNGEKYPFQLKLLVAEEYLRASDELTFLPNLTEIGSKLHVSRVYVQNVGNELLLNGFISEGSKESRGTNVIKGTPGRTKLTALDYWYLIHLYREEPSRTLGSYVYDLLMFSGVLVCIKTIDRIFTEAFPFKGNLRKSSIIPLDKFRENNLLRANEFIDCVRKLPLLRIKTFDEKWLKNSEGLCRKVRRDPLTGVVPPILSRPDFRNTYKILGMTSLDENNPLSFYYKIHIHNNDSYEFSEFLFETLNNGFIRSWDVIIGDRASYHINGDNAGLDDYMWNFHRMLLLWLPARCPEWNPTELVWRSLVRRLGIYPISQFNQKDAIAHIAADILDRVTREEVQQYYNKCFNN